MLGTMGNVLDMDGNSVGDSMQLGALGNYDYGRNLPPGVAWVTEREVGNLKPYRGDTFNHPHIFYHNKSLPAVGITQKQTFFDGTINTAGLSQFQTNWPGPNGLPGNQTFVLRRIGVDIEPILNIEANPPAFASTEAAMMVTAHKQTNALNKIRFLRNCAWELYINSRLIDGGYGLDDLPMPSGAFVGGAHSNTTATTINSSLTTRNGGPGDSMFEFPVPHPIFPNDQVRFIITPGVQSITFLDATGTAAISALMVKLFGNKVEAR